MSKEIKIKNTLFRFVTMRAPVNIEEGKKIKAFIFHPDATEGLLKPDSASHFTAEMSDPENSTLQMQLMRARAEAFAGTSLKSKKQLRDLVGDDTWFYSEKFTRIKKRN